MGDLRFKVLCDDGKVRTGHVPGKFRNRYFFRKEDYVLVSIRSFQPSMCDLLYKYNAQEVLKLREKNLLQMIQTEDNDMNLEYMMEEENEIDSEAESDVEIENENELNNSSLNKGQGDIVKTGEVIATAGNTGEYSTGWHLHFELWINGYSMDPTNFIDFKLN